LIIHRFRLAEECGEIMAPSEILGRIRTVDHTVDDIGHSATVENFSAETLK
jgi:hypothetical protein